MSDKKIDKALMAEMKIDKEALKKLKKKLQKVEGMPERGIETWFRLASKNLYARRQIVDTKSNILVTVNSIIISVILGSLYTRLDENPHLVWAITPMIITKMLSMAFAIFATRPKMGKGTFSNEEVQDGNVSLMTFDDFYRMPEGEYEQAIEKIMSDRKFLYKTIKKDIFHLGLELSKRYRNIRISYDIFLVGLIVSVWMFATCYIVF